MTEFLHTEIPHNCVKLNRIPEHNRILQNTTECPNINRAPRHIRVPNVPTGFPNITVCISITEFSSISVFPSITETCITEFPSVTEFPA